jgi:hypothetical protein
VTSIWILFPLVYCCWVSIYALINYVIFLFLHIAVPLGSVRGTPGYRGTPVGNHWPRQSSLECAAASAQATAIIQTYRSRHSWRYCKCGQLANPFGEQEQVCPALCVKGEGAVCLKIFASACPWNMFSCYKHILHDCIDIVDKGWTSGQRSH